MARKRWEVLSRLIREHDLKIGAEIGVKSGRNIAEVLRLHPNFIWYAIDPWKITENYRRWTPQMIAKNERQFDSRVGSHPNVTKMRMLSWDAAPLIEDGSLDLVFIDGDHSYEGVSRDIEMWLPKIRPGGVISGHDYDNTDKYGDLFKGVDRAVHEFFGDDFQTAEDHVWWRVV